NTSVPSSIILIDGRTPRRIGYREVDQISADLTIELNHTAGEMSSESNLMDVFSAELCRLKRIIAGMGLSASDGEDILQDVSIRALKQCRTSSRTALPSREDNVRWLIKVTVNRCLMEHRRRRTFRRHAGEILKRRLETKTASKAAVENVIVAEELEIVRESLQKLDDSLLAPIVLRYFCDLNSKEVGEILALSPSAVRSRLREARMILAKRLLERGVEP
ncbi:MAG TPA: sigma-70 family RNA polymerase sigma factor, partial [Sedimentisphaerales bacterium]|nr:sigma-70 family RNA polymerase sigma factor [Sedimentisphaerales bacterium]